MKSSALLVASLASAAHSSLVGRQAQAEADYANKMCQPNVTASAGATLPPCISIADIEVQCQPNGTQPLNYLAHAQCMCAPPSTFFADWKGCRNCLFVHGARSEQDQNAASALIGSVSNALCSGTPTAKFAAIYESLAYAASTSSGATGKSDRFPSQTAVSLYYTAAGLQGPGAITGDAAKATASTNKTSSANTKTDSGSRTSAPTGNSVGTASVTGDKPTLAPSSSSKSGAVPTGGFGTGWAFAIAGGALFAAI